MRVCKGKLIYWLQKQGSMEVRIEIGETTGKIKVAANVMFRIYSGLWVLFSPLCCHNYQ